MRKQKSPGKAKPRRPGRKARTRAQAQPTTQRPAGATSNAERLLSLRAFAERVGCSHTLVQRAIAAGRLAKGVERDELGRPRIADVEAAEAQWREEKLGERKPKAEGGMPSLIDAQTQSALELARERRLRNRVRRGELLPASVVQRDNFKAARIVRDNIMNVPARICAALASETNAGRVQTILETELRAALSTISQLLEESAA